MWNFIITGQSHFNINSNRDFLLHLGALGRRMTCDAERCVLDRCKCLLKRRHTDVWERSLVRIHISKASLDGKMGHEPTPNTTYSIFRMSSFIWGHFDSRQCSWWIFMFRSVLFPGSVPENQWHCLWLLHQSCTSEMVKCHIALFLMTYPSIYAHIYTSF